ncbi:uncharacterized protein DNG_10304 [Cephalotrichum gorgonifer]|uniref:Uncharacterized protein n=1 Tax=Cephalotrichum gorgonifer TaxID=2041049 RepID=A0AAE8N8L6_9PEZI|nr:uncharacterized protein DNG_10304 [Cephalotrichum gorgonifer]
MNNEWLEGLIDGSNPAGAHVAPLADKRKGALVPNENRPDLDRAEKGWEEGLGT